MLFVATSAEVGPEAVGQKQWRVIIFETAKEFIEQLLSRRDRFQILGCIGIDKSLCLIEGQDFFELFQSIHY